MTESSKTRDRADPPLPTRTETATAFGAILRARRRALSLTQEGLAERAGLSQKHVARMERAERLPTVHAVLLVAQALGMKAADLVGELEASAGRTGGSEGG